MKFVKDRDRTDHIVFAPLQTDFAWSVVQRYEEQLACTVQIKQNDADDHYTQFQRVEGQVDGEWCAGTITNTLPDSSLYSITFTNGSVRELPHSQIRYKDFTSAILIDGKGVHKYSASILQGTRYMGCPYSCIGSIALLLPSCFIDPIYKLISRNRGSFWKCVKRTFGMGDTHLVEHQGSVVGVNDVNQTPESWALRADKLKFDREPRCSCFGDCGRKPKKAS